MVAVSRTAILFVIACELKRLAVRQVVLSKGLVPDVTARKLQRTNYPHLWKGIALKILIKGMKCMKYSYESGSVQRW
jgi:hypothetical protein